MTRLFHAYFAALDETIALFGDLSRNPGDSRLESLAYRAKARRTKILNRLMAELRRSGIRSFAEGHEFHFGSVSRRVQ